MGLHVKMMSFIFTSISIPDSVSNVYCYCKTHFYYFELITIYYYCCCCYFCHCYSKEFSNGFRLLQEEQETDVSVCLSSGFRLKAHKAVLLARAPHLLQETAPNASIINLQGTEPSALKELIRCVLYV